MWTDYSTYKIKGKKDGGWYSWSRIPDYDTYHQFQEKLQGVIKQDIPLMWENAAWMKSAMNIID